MTLHEEFNARYLRVEKRSFEEIFNHLDLDMSDGLYTDEITRATWAGWYYRAFTVFCVLSDKKNENEA